jgi:hypothetical protein
VAPVASVFEALVDEVGVAADVEACGAAGAAGAGAVGAGAGADAVGATGAAAGVELAVVPPDLSTPPWWLHAPFPAFPAEPSLHVTEAPLGVAVGLGDAAGAAAVGVGAGALVLAAPAALLSTPP